MLVLALAVGFLLGDAASADSDLSANARARVRAVIEFYESVGDVGLATQLEQLVESGYIQVGSTGDSGTTALAEGSYITLNSTINNNHLPPPGKNRTSQVMDLAMTLAHEMEHVRQGSLTVIASNIQDIGGDNPAEIEGWSAGLSAGIRWVNSLTGGLEGLSESERAAQSTALAEMIGTIQAQIGEFPPGYGKGLNLVRPDGTPFASGAEAIAYLKGQQQRINDINARGEGIERGTMGSEDGGRGGAGPGVFDPRGPGAARHHHGGGAEGSSGSGNTGGCGGY